MLIEFHCFGGIGDAIMHTALLPAIDALQHRVCIRVPGQFEGLFDNHPLLVPWVKRKADVKYRLHYPSPSGCIPPSKHIIYHLWDDLCSRLYMPRDVKPVHLEPSLYCYTPVSHQERKGIGIQIYHQGHWRNKKVWPYFKDLLSLPETEAIEQVATLPQLVQKIANYRVIVCIEGTLAHIAKAVGTPCVVIYGGWSKPEWTGYPEQTNLVSPKCEKSCWNFLPCPNKHRCMEEITVARVKGAINGLYSAY